MSSPVLIDLHVGRKLSQSWIAQQREWLKPLSIHVYLTLAHPPVSPQTEAASLNHICLKHSLTCLGRSTLELLGIRTALKDDIGCSAAELVYGTQLRLPVTFFISNDSNSCPDPSSFVTALHLRMQSLKATPTRPSRHSVAVAQDSLQDATYIFVHWDTVCKPLQQPYDGLFKVLNRAPWYYTLEIKGHKDTVSVDRLKPAHIERSDNDTSIDYCAQPPTPPTPPTTTNAPSTPSSRTTHPGRKVHWPAYLSDFAP